MFICGTITGIVGYVQLFISGISCIEMIAPPNGLVPVAQLFPDRQSILVQKIGCFVELIGRSLILTEGKISLGFEETAKGTIEANGTKFRGITGKSIGGDLERRKFFKIDRGLSKISKCCGVIR